MTIEMTYTQARSNLAGLLDEVIENREIVVIHRRHGARAAVIAADDLDSLLETAYLLRSPRNAERLLTALEDLGLIHAIEAGNASNFVSRTEIMDILDTAR